MSVALADSAQYVAVVTASAKFTNAMAPGSVYRFTANVDCWVKRAATDGAAAADTADNHLVLSGQTILLVGDPLTATNNFVHVIRAGSTDGKATLSLLKGMGG